MLSAAILVGIKDSLYSEFVRRSHRPDISTRPENRVGIPHGRTPIAKDAPSIGDQTATALMHPLRRACQPRLVGTGIHGEGRDGDRRGGGEDNKFEE